MARDTWNFQVHEARDWPENPAGRGYTSGIFYTYGTSSTPFTTGFTAIFSALIRSGWTAETVPNHLLFSLGKESKSHNFINITGNGTILQYIWIYLANINSGSAAYSIYLGDEDGTSTLQNDKWYQVAFSANTSGVTFAVNGTNSPKSSLITDNIATFDVSVATKAGLYGAVTSASSANIHQINYGQTMPSIMVGPSAYSNQVLDLTDPTVLARIYDSNGDFKNPGEDGSLWFGDTYGENTPAYYFASGTPRVQKGTDTAAWYVAGSNNYTGRVGGPGGLRKQYES